MKYLLILGLVLGINGCGLSAYSEGNDILIGKCYILCESTPGFNYGHVTYNGFCYCRSKTQIKDQ
jgi:hypothetical protein